MSAAEALQRQIERDGFCVVEGVIPSGEVQAISGELLAVVERNRERSEGELAKTRSRGHRIGTQGVGDQRSPVLRRLSGRSSRP